MKKVYNVVVSLELDFLNDDGESSPDDFPMEKDAREVVHRSLDMMRSEGYEDKNIFFEGFEIKAVWP